MADLYANYPDGFSPGAVIRDILGADVIPGRVFYVGNNATLLVGEKTAADQSTRRAGSFFQPFATIDHAINQCASGRNDIILVRPSHAESVADAATIVMDTDAVHIIGLGSGEDRPIITFATDAAAAIPVTGDNCTMANMVFKCNIASQNHMIDLAATDFKLLGCDLREGTATGLSFVTADTADADSDRLQVKRCKFYAPTAGNYDNAIQLAKDFKQVRIEECDIYGDFDVAGIDVPAGGNAQVDLILKEVSVSNLQSGVLAVSINGTGNTGKMIKVYAQGDTLGTIVDAGGLEMYEVYEHDGTDQTSARLIAPLFPIITDSTSNILGADTADNSFASTNVAANADGSIIERLEYVQANMELPTDAGKQFIVQKSLTSSAIVTGGVDVTGTASGGDVLIENILLETDGTGLATGTNFTIEKDGGTGVLTFLSQVITGLDEGNEQVDMKNASVVSSQFAILDSGQKLVAKCTGSSCTGSGVIDVTLVCRRIADTSAVAAA